MLIDVAVDVAEGMEEGIAESDTTGSPKTLYAAADVTNVLSTLSIRS